MYLSSDNRIKRGCGTNVWKIHIVEAIQSFRSRRERKEGKKGKTNKPGTFPDMGTYAGLSFMRTLAFLVPEGRQESIIN